MREKPWGQLCNVFVSFLILKVIDSKSLHYSQGCALANLRLVFFADDFLEFEASGWDADFLYCKAGIFWTRNPPGAKSEKNRP